MRLIDADLFAEKFTGQYEFMKRVIAEQHTVDAVEVVRCKDCVFRDGTPGQPNIDCYQMHDDDFCSYGERKE